MSAQFVIEEEEDVSQTLDRYEAHLKERTHHHLGYPYNLAFAANSELASRFLSYSINNLGDPFVESNYGVHSRAFELSVLHYFADLWKLGRDEFWGYVTCSGTEGNMHGIYVAREVLPNAIIYATCESHYSVWKAAHMYRMKGEKLNSQSSGEMDYEHFEERLQANRKLGNFSAIISINVGTTVLGAIDNARKVIEVLHRNGFEESQYHIHVDGALFGMLLPHLVSTLESPHLSFDLPIASISVSGHKMLGCPMPCGVIIHRKENIKRIENHIPYLNSVDTTIMGSRNGQAAVFLWLSLKSKGVVGFEEQARLCIENAQKLTARLKADGVGVLLNPNSNTVVFERPFTQQFIMKWQLASTGEISHIVCMPNTGLDKLIEFADDLKAHRVGRSSRCIKAHVGPQWCRCTECSQEGVIALQQQQIEELQEQIAALRASK